MAINFTIIRNGGKFSVKPDSEPEFLVGTKVHYQGREGLANDGSAIARQWTYDPPTYEPTVGFWSNFIYPTAICESQASLVVINTYDRAAFTFGFAQFAAHVPDGDFVRWFRDMLQRPEANDYFPNVQVIGGRINSIESSGPEPLEDANTTERLMKYLNPTPSIIDDREVICAAKLMHWTMKYEGARALQVHHSVETARRILRRADQRVGLGGKGAELCCIVFDILHHGRGTFAEIDHAVHSDAPVNNLLTIGRLAFPERIRGLRDELEKLSDLMATKKWNSQLVDFE